KWPVALVVAVATFAPATAIVTARPAVTGVTSPGAVTAPCQTAGGWSRVSGSVSPAALAATGGGNSAISGSGRGRVRMGRAASRGAPGDSFRPARGSQALYSRAPWQTTSD